jgi:hypothetical protein
MNTLYTLARTDLLDALEALDEQRDAVVLVGAQAEFGVIDANRSGGILCDVWHFHRAAPITGPDLTLEIMK